MVKCYWYIVFSILLTSSVLAGQDQVYVWRNQQGVVVFSDKPVPGAKEVVLDDNSKNIFTAKVNASVLASEAEVKSTQYQLNIDQPMAQATIRDNTGALYIKGRVLPRFKKNFKVQLHLDGKAHSKPQPQAVFLLQNVDRGEHQIKMTLTDEKGKIIATSDSITFYMRRATLKRQN
jgi:hypothetical protein